MNLTDALRREQELQRQHAERMEQLKKAAERGDEKAKTEQRQLEQRQQFFEAQALKAQQATWTWTNQNIRQQMAAGERRAQELAAKHSWQSGEKARLDRDRLHFARMRELDHRYQGYKQAGDFAAAKLIETKKLQIQKEYEARVFRELAAKEILVSGGRTADFSAFKAQQEAALQQAHQLKLKFEADKKAYLEQRKAKEEGEGKGKAKAGSYEAIPESARKISSAHAPNLQQRRYMGSAPYQPPSRRDEVARAEERINRLTPEQTKALKANQDRWDASIKERDEALRQQQLERGVNPDSPFAARVRDRIARNDERWNQAIEKKEDEQLNYAYTPGGMRR